VNGATSELSVMMYQLTVSAFVNAFIAAHQRGVSVRILLDGLQTVNDSARSRLSAAGVPVHNSPSSFTNAHSKVLLIDRRQAVILSGNLNGYTMSSERNYAAVDLDPEDIADVAAVFEVDWAGSGAPDLACTRLLVSPVNARARLDGLIRGARQRLDLAVMYVSDSAMRDAIKARAAAQVPVRILLADPAWIDGNQATAAELAAAGVSVKFLKTYELHAKLVIADQTVFVGSENLSYTSLNRNREIGIFLTEPAPVASVRAQFEADWSAGVAP
jgi:phosphatidylserine/phosphatidylglycerophosphate/cardiolipin synthase-like enzyme